MERRFIIIGAFFALLSVALGAFGTHTLRPILEANGREATYQTATQYQMYHALALLLIAWLNDRYKNRLFQWAGYLFIVGIVLFTGSLYLLAIFDIGFMGAIAPIGGVAFLAGWGSVIVGVWRAPEATT